MLEAHRDRKQSPPKRPRKGKGSAVSVADRTDDGRHARGRLAGIHPLDLGRSLHGSWLEAGMLPATELVLAALYSRSRPSELRVLDVELPVWAPVRVLAGDRRCSHPTILKHLRRAEAAGLIRSEPHPVKLQHVVWWFALPADVLVTLAGLVDIPEIHSHFSKPPVTPRGLPVPVTPRGLPEVVFSKAPHVCICTDGPDHGCPTHAQRDE